MLTCIACDITSWNSCILGNATCQKHVNFGAHNTELPSYAKIRWLKQTEGIKYQVLLISAFIATCDRQSNSWWEMRHFQTYAPTYASAETVVDYCQ